MVDNPDTSAAVPSLINPPSTKTDLPKSTSKEDDKLPKSKKDKQELDITKIREQHSQEQAAAQ